MNEQPGRRSDLTRDQAREVQDKGRRILAALYAALRALKFYPVENVTVQQAIDELHALVTSLVAEEGGDFSIKLEDQVLITEDGYENLTKYPFDPRLMGQG